MEQIRNAYKSLVGTPEVKETFATCGHTRQNNIKVDLTEIGWEGLSRDRGQSAFIGIIEHGIEESPGIIRRNNIPAANSEHGCDAMQSGSYRRFG